jgi:hypothetical protein
VIHADESNTIATEIKLACSGRPLSALTFCGSMLYPAFTDVASLGEHMNAATL